MKGFSLTLAAAVAMMPVAAFAQSGQDQPVHAKVRVHDLDLTKPGGRDLAHQRLQKSADRACSDDSGGTDSSCKSDLMKKGRDQIAMKSEDQIAAKEAAQRRRAWAHHHRRVSHHRMTRHHHHPAHHVAHHTTVKKTS